LARPAVFLDRDGTLVRDRGFVHRVADLELLEQVVEGLRRMAALGYQLIITTNQSGIARGYFTEADAELFHRALCSRLSAQGTPIAAVYSCPFHPTEGVARYRCDSPLRKPAAGMILQAAADHSLDLKASFAVGDKKSDILAGQSAGCRTILLRTGAGGCGEAGLSATPDYVADDLADAAGFIERACGPSNAVPQISAPAYLSSRVIPRIF
jgi:D,D-heptose 1,7-bisphosphate phosphatase